MEDEITFTCSVCGETHTGFPDLAFDTPYYYDALSEEEKQRTAQLTADTCIIENKEFFVRGVLEIPLQGREDSFAYGVWVSLSQASFDRYQEFFESPKPGPTGYFGWFSNRLPGYPDTLELKTHVHLRPYPTRPAIELEPTDHPLAVEQRQGITLERVREILERNEHPGHAA